MDIFIHILIFLGSVAALFYFVGELLIKSLVQIAKFLGWKEFILAFFAVSFATSVPNFFVGLSAVIYNVPQLSLGDVVGGNVIDLTLAVALAALFARDGIPAQSKTVQSTLNFTVASAILPLILLLDGSVSRMDGFVLIAFFIFYFQWMFSRRDRFSAVYSGTLSEEENTAKIFFRNLGKVAIGLVFLLIASAGIIKSSIFFGQLLHVPLELIGILVLGLGNSIPEMYFSIASARRGETWMILGNLMGSVVVPTTLVLGMVGVIHPFSVPNFSPFVIGRVFLAISAIFFFTFVRSDKKITKREAIFLIFVYVAFVVSEVVFR